MKSDLLLEFIHRFQIEIAKILKSVLYLINFRYFPQTCTDTTVFSITST